jgi:hypothetical protein
LFLNNIEGGMQVKKIFIELLAFGISITEDYQKNKFKLKKGVSFSIKNKVSMAGNIKFFK